MKMKTRTRIILIIGLGLVGLVLAVYVRTREPKSGFAEQDDRKHLEKSMDDRKNKDRPEMDWTAPYQRIDIGVDYFIHQPVSEEIAKRTAKLGIEIAPFYDSTKIALIVIRGGKSDVELERLLKQSSANDVEIAEERNQWWERNKERITKEQEILNSQPEVVKALSRLHKRIEEIEELERTHRLRWDESSRLELEAMQEFSKIRDKFNRVTMLPKK